MYTGPCWRLRAPFVSPSRSGEKSPRQRCPYRCTRCWTSGRRPARSTRRRLSPPARADTCAAASAAVFGEVAPCRFNREKKSRSPFGGIPARAHTHEDRPPMVHEKQQFRLLLCGHKAAEAAGVCMLLMVQGDLGAATLVH